MKLKFTADSKDWIMFGVYAVVLLYFVAIAVLNMPNLQLGTSITHSMDLIHFQLLARTF
ncbi:MAG: hypothetical protein ACLR92_03425 [Bacilli bacterium]